MNKIRPFLGRYCIWVISMLLFSNCSNDEPLTSSHDHNNQSSNHKIVSSTDVPEVMEYIRRRIGADLTITLNKAGNNRQEDLLMGTVNTQEILELTDQEDRSSYSFGLHKPQSDQRISFLNFVVKESGDDFYAYVIEYQPDREWDPSSSQANAFLDYSGKITIYTDQGEFVSSSTFLSGEEVSRQGVEDCQTNGGNNNGGNTNENENQGDQGDNQENQESTGGHNIDINVVCGCPPQHPGGTTNPNCNCTLGDVITVTINSRGLQQALRTADPCAEECYQANGDPCPFGCQPDGTCLPDPDESQNDGVTVNLAVFLALDEIAGPNDHFVYPAENVNPANALYFDSVSEFEQYLLDNTLQQQFPVIANQDGTHTTRFRVRHGVIVPRDVNIWITQQLSASGIDYQIEQLETDYTGVTLGTSWSQQGYNYQLEGELATINLYGSFSYNLFIEDVGTIFTDSKHYQMQVNTSTGEPVSIVELNY